MLAISSPVLAVESDIYPYAGVTLGTALTSVRSDNSGLLHSDFNPGYMAGGAAGIAFNSYLDCNIDRIRIEAEMGYRSNEISSITNSQGKR